MLWPESQQPGPSPAPRDACLGLGSELDTQMVPGKSSSGAEDGRPAKLAHGSWCERRMPCQPSERPVRGGAKPHLTPRHG